MSKLIDLLKKINRHIITELNEKSLEKCTDYDEFKDQFADADKAKFDGLIKQAGDGKTDAKKIYAWMAFGLLAEWLTVKLTGENTVLRQQNAQLTRENTVLNQQNVQLIEKNVNLKQLKQQLVMLASILFLIILLSTIKSNNSINDLKQISHNDTLKMNSLKNTIDSFRTHEVIASLYGSGSVMNYLDSNSIFTRGTSIIDTNKLPSSTACKYLSDIGEKEKPIFALFANDIDKETLKDFKATNKGKQNTFYAVQIGYDTLQVALRRAKSRKTKIDKFWDSSFVEIKNVCEILGEMKQNSLKNFYATSNESGTFKFWRKNSKGCDLNSFEAIRTEYLQEIPQSGDKNSQLVALGTTSYSFQTDGDTRRKLVKDGNGKFIIRPLYIVGKIYGKKIVENGKLTFKKEDTHHKFWNYIYDKVEKKSKPPFNIFKRNIEKKNGDIILTLMKETAHLEDITFYYTPLPQ